MPVVVLNPPEVAEPDVAQPPIAAAPPRPLSPLSMNGEYDLPELSSDDEDDEDDEQWPAREHPAIGARQRSSIPQPTTRTYSRC